LTAAQLQTLWERSGGTCELSGIPFAIERPTGVMHGPYAASLDRIDATKGYEFSNVRLLCFAVNMALGAWGDSVFMRVVEAVANRAGGK